MRKNKIYTQGYTLKRLRDSGYVTNKVFDGYAQSDPRRWTLMIDPGDSSVFLTCYENRDHVGQMLFEFSDGGRKFPRNFAVITDSIEVLTMHLVNAGVSQTDKSKSFQHDVSK